jgi:hypothetical protein
MIHRIVLALLVVSVPAFAQPVAVPDCTANVVVTAGPQLDVTYRCRATVPMAFSAEDAAVVRHVRDMRDGVGNKLAEKDEAWSISPVNGLAEVHYRYDLAAYAKSMDSTSSAVLRGESVLSGLSGWLLSPQGIGRAPVIDIRAQTAEGLAFGWPSSTASPRPAAPT